MIGGNFKHGDPSTQLLHICWLRFFSNRLRSSEIYFALLFKLLEYIMHQSFWKQKCRCQAYWKDEEVLMVNSMHMCFPLGTLLNISSHICLYSSYKKCLRFWSVLMSHDEKSSHWQHISYSMLSEFGFNRILSPNHLGTGKETPRGHRNRTTL